LNDKKYTGKEFCVKLNIFYQQVEITEGRQSKLYLTKARPVKLKDTDEEKILTHCKGWLEIKEGKTQLQYNLEKVNDKTFYCDEKEKWYIDVEKDEAANFFDNFGHFSGKEGINGYIMDYVNPVYIRGTKIEDENQSNSFLLKIIKPDVGNWRCPETCKMLFGHCSCNTATLKGYATAKGVFNRKFCEVFGEVEKYTYISAECRLLSKNSLMIGKILVWLLL
jgi:hypothetical protein